MITKIITTTPEHSLLEIAGILNHKEAEKLRKSIAQSRKRSRKRMARVAKDIQSV